MTTNVGIKFLVYGADDVRRNVGYITSDLNNLEKRIKSTTGITSGFGNALSGLGGTLLDIGRSLTLVTAPLVAFEGALFASGIAFEDSFAGIAKTMDGVTTGFKDVVLATPEFRSEIDAIRNRVNALGSTWQQISIDDAFDIWLSQLNGVEGNLNAVFDEIERTGQFNQLTEFGKELRDQFRELALEIPIATTELLKIGELAGQLGVPKEAIIGFSEIAAQLSLATDITAENAATQLARFATVFGVADDELVEWSNRFGAALVYVGNTSSATESEILNMSSRLASLGPLVGLTAQEILGLSASMVDVNVKAERGGTSVQKVFLSMLQAMAEGGEGAENFALVWGGSIDEFNKALGEDALGTLQRFTSNLVPMYQKGQINHDMLVSMGISGTRVQEILMLLASTMGNVNDNVDNANMAWDQQIALQEEARKRYDTTKSFIQLLKNAFFDLGITVFDLYEKDIKKLLTGLTGVIKSIKNLNPKTLKLVGTISAIAVALVPVLIGLGVFLKQVGLIVNVIGSLGSTLLGLAVPILLITGTLTALYLAFENNFLGIADLVRDIANVLKQSGIPEQVQEIIDLFKAGRFADAINELPELFRNIWEVIKSDFVQGMIHDWAYTAGDKIKAAIDSFSWGTLFDGIKNAFQTIAVNIDLLDLEKLGIVQDAFRLLSKFINEIDPKAFLVFVGGVTALALPTVVAGITAVASALWGVMLAALPAALLLGIIAAYQTDFGGLATKTEEVGESVKKLDEDPSAYNFLQVMRDIRNAVFAIPMGIATWIGSMAGIDVPAGMEAWKNTLELLADTEAWSALFSGMWDWLSNPDHEGGLANGFYKAGDWIGNPDHEGGLVNSVNKIPGYFDEMFSSLGLDGMFNINIGEPVGRITENMSKWFTDTIDSIGKLFTETLPNALSGLGTMLYSKLQDPFDKALQAIINQINAVISGLNQILSFVGIPQLGLIGTTQSVAPLTAAQEANIRTEAGVLGIPYEAAGGPVRGGMPYIVGERGMELFFPNTDGTILPNDMTRRIMQSMLSFRGDSSTTSNSSVYNPVFNASPTQELVRTNNSMYENWLYATQGA